MPHKNLNFFTPSEGALIFDPEHFVFLTISMIPDSNDGRALYLALTFAQAANRRKCAFWGTPDSSLSMPRILPVFVRLSNSNQDLDKVRERRTWNVQLPTLNIELQRKAGEDLTTKSTKSAKIERRSE
jgi:hypothetical protein